MPSPSFWLEVVAVAGLLIFVGLRWRFVRNSTASALRYATTRPEPDMDLLLGPIEPGNRDNRARALMLAAIAWKGDPASAEDILGLADEFLQYLEGDNAVMPRPDTLSKGRIPR